MKAFQEGIVTSTSLMVTGSAFAEAVALARNLPELDVGLHITLVEEPAVLGRASLPTLVDDAGQLPSTKGEFFKRALLGQISWEEVEREIRAQIARFHGTGLPLSHLDSHQHLHMFAPVFQIVSRLAREMDNVWIRNPAGPWGKSSGARIGRWAQQVGLNLTSLWSRKLYGSSELRMPDGMYGFAAGGGLNRTALEQIFRAVPDGLYELNCHPGEADAETRARYGGWDYRWEEELEALTAPETRAALEEQGIVLTSFSRPH